MENRSSQRARMAMVLSLLGACDISVSERARDGGLQPIDSGVAPAPDVGASTDASEYARDDAGIVNDASAALDASQPQDCRSSGGAAFEQQTGRFEATFAVVVQSAGEQGVGLVQGTGAGWADLATTVRFGGGATGDAIDVRDGAVYRADVTLTRQVGATYLVRELIDLAAPSYSVFVTPPGGGEVALATGYAFGKEQSGVTSLDHWAIKVESGELSVCGFAVRMLETLDGGHDRPDAASTDASEPAPGSDSGLAGPDAGPGPQPDAGEVTLGDYYVDVVHGDDSNDGSLMNPWKTLSRALQLTAPATVVVREGDYGRLLQSSPTARSGALSLVASPRGAAVVTGIAVGFGAKAAANLRVDGFVIKPEHRNGGNVVQIQNATDFSLLRSELTTIKYAAASSSPGNPKTFVGLALQNTERITIESNHISSVARGITLDNSQSVAVRGNFVSPQSGTAIMVLNGNSGVVIEDNHVRGQDYVPYPTDPDAPLDPHASIISLRSGDVSIRNNVFHGMGSSSGIMTYLPDAAGGLAAYSNIRIEGNLIYDVENYNVLRFYNLADNVVIRNNLILGHDRDDTCAPVYKYNTALAVQSLAAGFDGSGLLIANNILAGMTSVKGSPVERNNIFWSYDAGGFDFLAVSPSGTSKIVTSAETCVSMPTYFQSGFFASPPDLTPDHGKLLDLVPSPFSEAVDFGDPALQLERLLGTLDSNGLFVVPAGYREVGRHSAGPYEP